MTCNNCGNELKEGASFCSNCGTAVTGLSEQEQKRRNKPFRKVVIGIIVIAVVLCAAGGAGYYFFGNPTQNYIGAEKGSGLTKEEAEQIFLSDVSEEDWQMIESANEEIREIIIEYSDDNGYIASEDVNSVLNAVTEQVDQFYDNGIVVYYSCGSNSVSFEYASGLTAYYEPSLEGYSAGNGSTDIITIDPFASGTSNGTMTNRAHQSGDDLYAALSGVSKNIFSDDLKDALSDGSTGIFPDVSMIYYEDDEVTVSELQNLAENTFFLWNGHGGFTTHYGESYPVLCTREKASELSAAVRIPLSSVALYIDDTGYFWSITPDYIKDFFNMDDGLVYLSACHSGQNDAMAEAFMDVGAETVFVNVGEGAIQTKYTQDMMQLIIEYMCGVYDDKYHTASEALDLANISYAEFFEEQYEAGNTTFDIDGKKITCKTLDEYIEKMNGGSYVALRGEGAYTICSCIRGEITFNDDMTQDEISDALESLSVELFTEDGASAGTAGANEDSAFYFNNLEPGTYEAVLYQSGKQICEPVSVNVEEHRYTSVSLPYSQLVTLEGYVYDTDGEQLSGVTVSADMAAGSDLWSDETRTNDEGYYTLEVYGENTYALTYSKSGYKKQETTFEITSKLFEEAQKGIPCTLEDVELLSDELYLELYAEVLEEYVGTGYRFALACIDEDDIPELVVMNVPSHLSDTYFYFLQDDDLNEILETTQYGSFQFASKENQIWLSGWTNGVGSSCTLVTWTGESFETVTSMWDHSLGMENGYDITDMYVVNDVTVTQSEYEAAYAELENSYDWTMCYCLDIFEITAANISDMMENPEAYIIE